MNKDERLLPLPTTTELQTANHEYPASYSPFYDEDSFEDRRSIREYFNVIYKRLPLILALTVLTTAVMALYMYRQPSMYQAQAEMIIEPRKPKQQNKDAININFGNDVNYYNTQLKLLQNPDLMTNVVVRLGLHHNPNLFPEQRGLLSSVRAMFAGEKAVSGQTESSLPVLTDANDAATDKPALSPQEKALAERYAGTLLGGLSVEQVERTNLVNIIVRSTNPEVAAKVADTVALVFITQDKERETQGAKKSLDDLTKSIEELEATIANQEQEYIQYVQSSGLALQDKGNEVRAGNLQTLSQQWLSAMEERGKIQARYNTAVQANARGEGRNIPDLTESKIYQETVKINTERKNRLQDDLREIDKDIEKAETEKASLLVKYQPDYYPVKQVEEKIASLKATRAKKEKEVNDTINREQQKIEKEAVQGALVSLKSQLDAALTREAQLRNAVMNETSQANVQGQAEFKLTSLKSEIANNRSLLDSYKQNQKQQELAIASSEPDNLKVTSYAQTPGSPIGPNRPRNIMIAFLISLAAGIGLAFLFDYLDDSIKTSDDVGRHLGLPTLALIPHQAAVQKGKLSLIPKNGNGANLPASTALVALEDNRSAMAEAYRHLRTSLLFSSAGKPPQTVLVTSSQPAEGKTTTAINTAITLAQSGADVVIIDCDLRRPRLHSHFALENTGGLTNYLSGEKNTEHLIKSYPGLPKMKIITSGPIPPNPAELLSSNEMKNLLQFLKGNFKHVIIDSPPAISFTDAAILSTQVDGVILVAMAGKSSIHLMRRFKQRLHNIGARIYGVVLNGIKADSVEYGYYGYSYDYNSYYAAHDDDSTPLMEEVEATSAGNSIHTTKG